MTPANGEGRETDVDRMEERYDIYPIRTGTRFFLCKEGKSQPIPIARFTSPLPPQKSLPPPTVPAGEEKKEEEEQLKRGVQITGRKVEKRGWEKTAAFLVCVGETPLCGFSDFGEMVLGDGEGGSRQLLDAFSISHPSLLILPYFFHDDGPTARSGGGNRKVNSYRN